MTALGLKKDEKPMMIPVRCFTCGKPIGQLWEEFSEKNAKGETPEKFFQKKGLTRYCCRRMLLSHKDVIDEIIKYEYK